MRAVPRSRGRVPHRRSWVSQETPAARHRPNLFPVLIRRHYNNRKDDNSYNHSLLQIHPRVQAALSSQNQPVVALESTILTHGLPYPNNLQLADRLDRHVLHQKDYQVVPATIAVERNVACRIGLTEEELRDLCTARSEGRAHKISTRELGAMFPDYLQQQNHDTHSGSAPHATPRHWGATTVAATMRLAHMAGIPTFCTGGIGGVHRNGHVSMDVSADLVELGRTPVIVVSAGIKSILDVPRTLEVLETNGVLTLAYGTDEFPAFFSPHSGIKAPARVNTPEEVASMYWAARDLQLTHGILVAVPNHDPAGANVERAIQEALREADDQKIAGQHVTPYILQRVNELTQGDSLRRNVALVEQNARVSAEIATAVLEEQKRRSRVAVYGSSNMAAALRKKTRDPSRVIVLGGCVQDITCRPVSGKDLLLHTSNPAICTEMDGGVGRNIAEALGRLGEAPVFYSAIGNDARGQGLRQRLETEMNVQVKHSVPMIDDKHTATYVAALDGTGDLLTAYADMSILEDIGLPWDPDLEQASALVMDANPPIHILRQAAQRAQELGVTVFLEPTSVPKAQLVAQDRNLMAAVTAMFPNATELCAMAAVQSENGTMWNTKSSLEYATDLRSLEVAASVVLASMNSDAQSYLVVTLGAQGVLLAVRASNDGTLSFQHLPPSHPVRLVHSSSGAGDSLCGAFLAAVLQGWSLEDAVSIGMDAAVMSLECGDRTISAQLSREWLEEWRGGT